MSLNERTIAYSLTIKGLGTSRKVAQSYVGRVDQDGVTQQDGLVRSDAEPDRLRVSKRILQSEELDAVKEVDRQLRAFIRKRSVPYIFKAGIYLIPTKWVTEIDDEVEKAKTRRACLVEALAGRVDAIRESDRAALGSLFDESDYPSADDVREVHRLETQYISLDVPGSLKALSKDVFDRERARIERELRDAGEAIRQVQRAQLDELVKGLLDRLTPGVDGRKKSIRKGGPLDQTVEFLDRYGTLNVTDDAELAAVVERAKQILTGVDADVVRTSEAVAAKVAGGMREVLGALAPLVEVAPRRRFRDVG